MLRPLTQRTKVTIKKCSPVSILSATLRTVKQATMIRYGKALTVENPINEEAEAPHQERQRNCWSQQ